MANIWRLITSGPGSASYNMALDEAIADTVRKGNAPPTLRLYTWDRPSVTLGCFQNASSINIKYCISENIPVVRRPTGGRAVLHSHELTYGFAAGTAGGFFSQGLLESYRRISAAFVLALNRTGLHAEAKKGREKGTVLARNPHCFQSASFGEISINRKKAVGSAQKRWSNGLLQQGSIPYTFDKEFHCKIFGEETASALTEMMTGIQKEVGQFNEAEFMNSVAESFEETFGVIFESSLPSEEECLLAGDLEDRKYLRREWNLRL